ncbi:nucleoporin GLE1 [Harpegnathos saltator]|uniref:nucleoporin GLE1 n=1 Tax=Harpegnathos saltator TaxID=610380 RepID=UPI00058E72BE|nr:nucleoporin GLE1 [Harpegnathos saltator]
MSFHRENKNATDEKENMEDITSDFVCFKISALKKAARISMAEIKNVTIGPESIVNKNVTNDKLDNIQDEQNSCNMKNLQKINTSPKYHTISTLNGISFSVKKILQESELQRKEEVRKKMEHRIQCMNENSRVIKENMEKLRMLMAHERECRDEENLAHILAEQERIAKEEEMKRRHEQQLHAQRIQEQKEGLEREMEEYRKRMKEKEELLRAIVIQRSQFTARYCDIVSLSKTCKDKQALNIFLASHGARIKELWQQIEAIDEKIRCGDMIATDVNSIEALVHHIEDMLSLFRTEMEKADAQYEAELVRKAQTDNEIQDPVTKAESTTVDKVVSPQQPAESGTVEKEDKDQSTNAKANQEVVVAAPVSPSATNALFEPSTSDPKPEQNSNDPAECKEGSPYEYVDYESLDIYNRSRQFLAVYRQSYEDFLHSSDTKKFRFECQKAINIPVNAIAGTNEQHLRDKYDRLQSLLTGRSSPNVMQHPQGIAFCKDHLAKKIVSQGETLISSKPEMAFPIAAIVVALWNEHKDFGELVLAHLHEACPFAVPIFPLQQDGQSNEDYYKSLGCKYSEDGSFEKQDKYLKRMSGLMRLYISITVTSQRKGVTKTHPHGLQYAWRWLAAVLNIEPRADTCDLCATLILDMLEVAGNVLWTAYPNQFHKLLILLTEQYYPRMQNITGAGGGPLMRLEEFLSNALAKSVIRIADGMLPPNFW